MNENQDNMSAVPPSRVNTIEPDWLLRWLVSMVNRSEGAAAGVTLNVGGLLISGEMVGGREYFAGIGKDMANGLIGVSKEVADGIESQWKQMGDDVYAPYAKLKEEEETPVEIVQSIHFIHLRNARIFHPGGKAIPANRGIWWRGRLEAVDGFMLGTLSEDG